MLASLFLTYNICTPTSGTSYLLLPQSRMFFPQISKWFAPLLNLDPCSNFTSSIKPSPVITKELADLTTLSPYLAVFFVIVLVTTNLIYLLLSFIAC